MNQNKRKSIVFYKIIPTRIISRIAGFLARIPLPEFCINAIIRWYAKKYDVRLDEIEPSSTFRSFEDFFTRRLKKGVHAFDMSWDTVISPVDARIDQYGQMDNEKLMQAKGIFYALSDLIPSEYHRNFLDGSFITMYLSPGDYHRIHSPVSGFVEGYIAVPGRLFSVQEFMVGEVGGLYTKNERIVSFIDTGRGKVAVCMIGAMNVGKISLSYSGAVTNRVFGKKQEYFFRGKEKLYIRKGDELGVFHLGSTVILLFQKNSVDFDAFMVGSLVKVGQRMARFKK